MTAAILITTASIGGFGAYVIVSAYRDAWQTILQIGERL